MLSVWVTLVALESVLSFSVNSSGLFGLRMKSYFGFDLLMTDRCCSDTEGYSLYMSLEPLNICNSLQFSKLTHTKAENLTFLWLYPFLKLCISISAHWTKMRNVASLLDSFLLLHYLLDFRRPKHQNIKLLFCIGCYMCKRSARVCKAPWGKAETSVWAGGRDST